MLYGPYYVLAFVRLAATSEPAFWQETLALQKVPNGVKT